MKNVRKCVLANGGHFAHMILTGWSCLIWHNFVKRADIWIKIRSIAYMGMHNSHIKFGWKIPSHFGNIATSPQGGGDFFWLTLYIEGAEFAGQEMEDQLIDMHLCIHQPCDLDRYFPCPAFSWSCVFSRPYVVLCANVVGIWWRGWQLAVWLCLTLTSTSGITNTRRNTADGRPVCCRGRDRTNARD